MITKDPVNSVHDEQFDAENKVSESTGEETTTETGENDPAETAGMPAENTLTAEEVSADEDTVVEAAEIVTVIDAAEEETVVDTAEEETVVEAAEEETVVEAVDADPVVDTLAEAPAVKDVVEDTMEKLPEEKSEEKVKKEILESEAEEAKTDVISAEETAEETSEEVLEVSASEETDEEAAIKSKVEEDTEAESSEGDTEETSEVTPEEKPVNYDLIILPPVDYSGNSRKELIETLKLNVDNRPPSEIYEDVNRIKELFYKKTKAEFNEKRLNFAKEGGNIEDYKPEFDELENQMKGILDAYRSKRNDYNKVQEGEKQENLRKKHEIIENIKELVNREEAINKTFQEFRNLQNEWHSIGIVPQSALKDLWENYHHSVEIFYDYIKINRELRDLDLKRNLEAKIDLCEKAEELLLEPNAINAFKLLQEYHDQWREIGPVPHENKNDIWERFREATSKVNKRHHEFFEKQKDEQKRNLDAKTALCEKAEEIANSEILTFSDFKEKSEAIIEFQKLWRSLGFAPKKYNNKIYLRFRAACDTFFEKKRAFFAESKEIQVKNMQLKTDLCMKAEALQESTDWKETSEILIKLQKEWKDTGPVPKKYSEKIWKRFRKACDTFFTNKSEFFAGRDTSYEDNLAAKLALLDELESFDQGDDPKAGFEMLKEIQQKWTEIGYVPFNKKDEIAKRYKDALNKQFDKLQLNDEEKNMLKYRTRVDSAKTDPRAARKVRNEREKFFSKIKQLESDIVLWENNIGFFAKSKNADTMIKEVEEKIADAKKNLKLLEEKVKLIDKSMLEDE